MGRPCIPKHGNKLTSNLSPLKLGFESFKTRSGSREMKILTDDPDWARDIYEARALAIKCVRNHGRAIDSGECLQVIHNGLTITYHPDRSPLLLTIDAPDRVL